MIISVVFAFLVGVGFVIATPDVLGHSFEELSGVQARITGNCSAGNIIASINSTGGVTCRNVGAGTPLPSGCANNQVAKYVSGAWVCRNDIDTDTTIPKSDTRCDTSGRCGQVCIGSSCRTSMPSAITRVVCTQGWDCSCPVGTFIRSYSAPCTVATEGGICTANEDSWGRGSCCICEG